MRKVIAAINMTIDGYCDHTAGIADEQLHEHYSELLNNSGVVLYGRITYRISNLYSSGRGGQGTTIVPSNKGQDSL